MKAFVRSALLFVSLIVVSSCKVNRAISFDGVDDYIDVGNIYDQTKFPITVCARIWVDPAQKNQAPIFVSQEDSTLYNGFWFVINPTHLFAGYGDGLGENHPAYRRDKSAEQTGSLGKWAYVAGVIRGRDAIDVYIDGKNIGGDYSGSSTHPMASDFPLSNAKLGLLRSNGNTFHYTGMIDDFRIWNRALTEQEISAEMKNRFKPVDAKDLIGHWSFNEKKGLTVSDSSPNKFNGELKGNAQRVVAK